MTNPVLKGLQPTHPGEILREDILPALKHSKTAIAGMLGISRQTLHDVLKERQAITTPLALKLAKLTNTTAKFWLNLQQDYDLRTTEPKLAAELEKIPTLEAA